MLRSAASARLEARTPIPSPLVGRGCFSFRPRFCFFNLPLVGRSDDAEGGVGMGGVILKWKCHRQLRRLPDRAKLEQGLAT
jgi:hypothetical protein